MNELVASVTEKVENASDRMEDRIAEFNALMEVVQGEAEQVFIGTAAAMREVQEGARALGGGPVTDPPSRIEVPDPELEVPDADRSSSGSPPVGDAGE